MAQSVKLADDVMAPIREECVLQSRSVAGQIAHWVKIGKAVEQSGTFDNEHIRRALAGEGSPDDLTPEEQDVWFAEFGAAMTQPSTAEETFFAERRKTGQGVGLDDNGMITRQCNIMDREPA